MRWLLLSALAAGPAAAKVVIEAQHIVAHAISGRKWGEVSYVEKLDSRPWNMISCRSRLGGLFFTKSAFGIL